ncbi:hypothetical protein MSAN_00150200 [Mycena sanguinolenta]|uniref:Uncharacterized protein n=1 Tax=Mycena sanguinolenta TaxID=230812 RepID=A0A8H6ZE12_9AGAR|nr:hypothetical protein MSAN_00150200 [Mycena sanguinolenta]
MSQGASPFLPPELEREIFEAAAVLHPESALNLQLVSHRVNEWIERIKYRTVADRALPTISCRTLSLLGAIRSNSKPASFFRDRVRHLFVEGLSDEVLDEILSACSEVQSLVLFQTVGHVPSLGATRPRRLSLYLHDLSEDGDSPRLSRPIFAFVTHLDLFDFVHNNADKFVAELALLPALTHLALWQNSMRSPELTDLLARCSRLKALIQMHGSMPLDPAQSVDDVRFVAMIVSDDDYPNEWAIGTEGGVDFWARADAFIAKKRRGEIKPSSRCYIEAEDGI